MSALDAQVRPVQCPHCGSWCLLGQSNGFKVVVTAQPLTVEGYRAALMAGLDVYGLSTTRRLKLVHPGGWNYPQRLLAHPCKAFADVRLEKPPAAPQSLCPGRAGCTRSAVGQKTCEVCDPPPFDHALFVSELGARVVSIEIDGREVYHE